jgi:hypothetical protein
MKLVEREILSLINHSYSILQSERINLRIQFPSNIIIEIYNLSANYINKQFEIVFTTQGSNW